VGQSDGKTFNWHVASNTTGFGDLLDFNSEIFTGDYNGDKKTDVAFYHPGDGNWWIGQSNGSAFVWDFAGNTSGFGDLLSPNIHMYQGDFDGDGKTDVGFYFNGDSNWWVGQSNGATFTWRVASNTTGFGDLLDGNAAFFMGDFNGDKKTDVTFYHPGDGNWLTGLSDGRALGWHFASNTTGFGDLLK